MDILSFFRFPHRVLQQTIREIWVEFYSTILLSIRFSFIDLIDLVAVSFIVFQSGYRHTNNNMFSINLSPINRTVGLTVFQHEEIDVSDMRNIDKFISRINAMLIYSWNIFEEFISGAEIATKVGVKKWNWNLRAKPDISGVWNNFIS